MDQELRRKFSGGAFEHFLGFRIHRFGGGESEMSMEVKEDFLTGIRAVHGGVTYSLLDHAMGGAVFSSLEQGMACVTVKLEIEYLKAIRRGRVVARAWVTRRRGRTVWARGEVENDDRIAARGFGKFRVVSYGAFVRLA